MCMNQPNDPKQAPAPGSNAAMNLVRKTNLGKMVDGGNRDAYHAYVQQAAMNGQQAVPYNQWVMASRHQR